jgi:hypothetical protein
MSTKALVFLTNLQMNKEQIQKEKNKHWKFNVLEKPENNQKTITRRKKTSIGSMTLLKNL